MKITGDRIVLIQKSTFLRAIGIPENAENLKVQETTAEQFQLFLNHIGYAEDFNAKKFKKSDVPGPWTVLMHFILRGLSGKHGGTYTLSKD